MSVSTGRGPAYDLAAIAARLEEHARSAPPASAQLLGALARGLSGGGAGLAATDLATAYPPESLLPDRVVPRPLNGLLWLMRAARDVLIFLPVFWTWYQLGRVLLAFGSAPAGANFLYGWQQGTFGGAGFDPLSDTAVWVAGFLGGVIALALLVHVAEGLVNLWTDRTRERDEVAQLLALATYLIPARSESMREEVRGANETLQGVRSVVNGLRDAMGAATGSMSRAAADMRLAADGITEALVGDPREQLVQALALWQNRMEELASAIRDARTPAELLEEVGRLTRSAVHGQERMSEQTGRMLELLGDQNRLIEARSDEVSTFAASVMERISRALDDLEKVAGGLSSAQDRLGVFTEESARTLGTALNEFTEISGDLGFLIKDVQRDVNDRSRGAGAAVADGEDRWS
ncbi:hypothetical protein [Actinorugispora endophytica]|uniref:Uncharacterized protein n=1 Tax=Actinorugispora endophytica TaxID=1605990 RepID=A0A4R6UZ37_9ACTN|nr:hypothetical protein [Actinorugispora endophytica]TDQ51586.1 hypothetical protein EV190_11075 [Actinorugispora endophytica]